MASPSVRPHRTARWRRLGLTLVVLLAVGYAGAGWYVSEEIIGSFRVAEPSPPEYDTEVVALTDDQITLRRPDELDLVADGDAVLGLAWEGGYGQVGPTTAGDDGLEVRSFRLLHGTPPPVGEGVVDLDSFAFPADPAMLGLGIETVRYPAPLGQYEAWFIPGEGTTWLVAVHGLGADRHEFLRLHDAIADLRYPTLIVRYRHDPGAPSSARPLILGGQEEWEDVAAAVAYAQQQGASDIVLAGASMGGALVLGYLVEGDPTPVRGVVLEAPIADLREAVRLRSAEALPIGGSVGGSILAVGRAAVWVRTGLDFDAVDYVARAEELAAPMLLFHGTEDPKVPVAISEALAAARPDLVEFHPVVGGAHVRAWNEDPDAYAVTVRAFLERIGRAP